MIHDRSPAFTLNVLGVGVMLALLGDATLYIVLPTHTGDAGIALANVGLMLSANRLIRLALNGPAGVLVDRLPRRAILLPAMLIGATSTLLYLPGGFWPMLLGRLMWGIAWVGIWIGGSAVALDLAVDANRGRIVGRLQMWFFIAVGVCSVSGGLLTDIFSYDGAFAVAAACGFVGFGLWALLLPETSEARSSDADPSPQASLPVTRWKLDRSALVAMLVLGLNWLAFISIVSAVLPLLLEDRAGEVVRIAGRPVAISTLTGMLVAANMVVSLFAAPLAGSLSDRARNRWGLVAVSLVVGQLALMLIAAGGLPFVIVATMLAAAASSVVQTQVYTLVGDAAGRDRRALGLLSTVSDAGAAAGPLLAYSVLLPMAGLDGAFAILLLLTLPALPVVVWAAGRELALARLATHDPQLP